MPRTKEEQKQQERIRDLLKLIPSRPKNEADLSNWLKNLNGQYLFLMTLVDKQDLHSNAESGGSFSQIETTLLIPLGTLKEPFLEELTRRRGPEYVKSKIKDRSSLDYSIETDREIIQTLLFTRIYVDGKGYTEPKNNILYNLFTEGNIQGLPKEIEDYLEARFLEENAPAPEAYEKLLRWHLNETFSALESKTAAVTSATASPKEPKTTSPSPKAETVPASPTTNPTKKLRPPPPPRAVDTRSFSERLQNNEPILREEWFPSSDIQRLMDSIDSFGTGEKAISPNADPHHLFGGLIALPSKDTAAKSGQAQNEAGLKRFEQVLEACKKNLIDDEQNNINRTVNFALHNGTDHFTHLQVTLHKNDTGEIQIEIENINSMSSTGQNLEALTTVAKTITGDDKAVTSKTNAKGDQINNYDCGAWTLYYLAEEANKAKNLENKDPFGLASIVETTSEAKDKKPNPEQMRLDIAKKLLDLDANTQPDSDAQKTIKTIEQNLTLEENGNISVKNVASENEPAAPQTPQQAEPQPQAPQQVRQPSASISGAPNSTTVTVVGTDYFFDPSNDAVRDEWLKNAAGQLNSRESLAKRWDNADIAKIDFLIDNRTYDLKTHKIDISITAKKQDDKSTYAEITLSRQDSVNPHGKPVSTWTCTADFKDPKLSDDVKEKMRFDIIAAQSLELRKAQIRQLSEKEVTRIGIADINETQTNKRHSTLFEFSGSKPCYLSPKEERLIQAHLESGYKEVYYNGNFFRGLSPLANKVPSIIPVTHFNLPDVDAAPTTTPPTSTRK